ncbi:MAG: hypothetical protein U0531_18615 [Dehalococcoidia bacterium]
MPARDWVLIFALPLGTLTLLSWRPSPTVSSPAAPQRLQPATAFLLDRHATLEQAHVKAMALRDLTSRKGMPGNTPLLEGQASLQAGPRPGATGGPAAALAAAAAGCPF